MDIYTTAQADAKAEIRGLRSQKAKVFRLPDGSKRHLCFGAPIHYWTDVGEGERPETAEYDDIDIRLQYEVSAEKTFNSYIAQKNTFTYGFRDDGLAEKYIGIRRGAGNQMEWTLREVSITKGKEKSSLGNTKGKEKSSLGNTVQERFDSIERLSEFSFKHCTADYEVVTDFNEVHIRSAIKTKNVTDFLIRERIDLTGIKILNKQDKSGEYIPIDNEFHFETTDGYLLWIPAPMMWAGDAEIPASHEITHRLYEEDGALIYEKAPTEKGKAWLAAATGDIYIDGDTYTGATGDGYVQGHDEVWSSAHSGGDDYSSATTTAASKVYYFNPYTSWIYYIHRFFLFFDTSALSGVVQSCDLYIYGTVADASTLCVQKSTISGTSVTGTANYNSFSGNYYDTASASTGWVTFNFDATGKSDVSKTGYTKVCVRQYNNDYLNTSSGITQNDSFGATFYTANNSTYKPYLDIVESSPPAAPTNVSATDGTHTDKVRITWTKSSGATGYKVYRAGSLIATLGDVATYDDTGADAPTITPGSAVASDGSSTAHVALSLSGTSVNNGTSHSYTVKAVNAAGDSDASTADTGYRGHGSLTYQWQVSEDDLDDLYSNIDGATTESYNYSGPLGCEVGRYYKCVLNATGATSQTTTANRGWRKMHFYPKTNVF